MSINEYATVHDLINGPGDARPTANQIIKDEGLEGKLVGKIILITGCSSGIGIQTAKSLYSTGATLYLTARDLNKAKSALGDELILSPNVHLLQLDLNSLASVRECATDFLSKSKQLNIFIANAGVMVCPEGKTIDGFETQLGTNHLAHFLLFNLLKGAMLSSVLPTFASRVIFLSSIAHRIAEVNFDNVNLIGIYNPWIAYGQSKTCNLWTANQIERLYSSQNLHAFSVHPGAISNGMSQYMSPAEIESFTSDPTLAKLFKSPEQGAATTVWAATSKALEGRGGKYLEDCQIIGSWKDDGQWTAGHAAWAYDVYKEEKLWEVSEKLVGLQTE